MTTQKALQWQAEPQEVWVNCQEVKKLEPGGEFIVRFTANREGYISLVPMKFVDSRAGRLQALVIADVDGGLLVDIPMETLSPGPRILVREGEKDSVPAFTG